MIKLFWNTSLNQDDSFELDWGKYHAKTSKDWVYFLLKNVNYTFIESDKEINKGDTLILVDSGIHFKESLYKKLKTKTKNFFLFHINDEQLDRRSMSVYDNFDFIWRTCCSPKYLLSNKVKCIPPGYKSGFQQKFELGKQILLIVRLSLLTKKKVWMSKKWKKYILIQILHHAQQVFTIQKATEFTKLFSVEQYQL